MVGEGDDIAAAALAEDEIGAGDDPRGAVTIEQQCGDEILCGRARERGVEGQGKHRVGPCLSKQRLPLVVRSPADGRYAGFEYTPRKPSGGRDESSKARPVEPEGGR